MEPVQSWDLTPTAVHRVAVDPAGDLLACARGDGLISILHTSHQQVCHHLISTSGVYIADCVCM